MPETKQRSALEDFISDIRVERWRIYWKNLRCAFIAEVIPGMLYKDIMSTLGFLAKDYFFRFQVIPGFTTVSMLMDEGYSPEEALEKYAWLYTVGGRGKTEIVEADIEKPRVIVRIYNSAVSCWFKRNIRNVKAVFPFFSCPWWGYNWVGAVRAALEKSGRSAPPLTYYSEKCFALGDDYCEFYIEPACDKEDPFKGIEEELTYLARNKYEPAAVQAPSSEECGDIWKFLNKLEMRSDGTVGIGRERILMVEGGMYSIAQMLVPVELFGGVVYAAYMKAHVGYGRLLAKQGEKHGVEKVVNFFLSSTSSMGWGKSELIKFEESEVVFRVYQSIYAEVARSYIARRRLAKRPICTYGWIVEGILNHFAETKGEPPFTSREEKCVAKGDDYCEFVLQRSSSPF
ncbi:MAG: V4R domain-containing protein [Candidatus Jordarchaeales archaeon]